ncbi:hypothetical protein CATYP_10275 [Corynebacterium atypicum]|uniref:CshA domain-containing protein n=1 Tax=Corynebacterium atypicum TaxID=191610 RepID=A0ABM5QPV6_9CORY|nr:hypothetical protein CATYP_10275 [Corynebacterium atypicum]
MPGQGTFTIDSNGVVTYKPAAGLTGKATTVTIVATPPAAGEGTEFTATYTPTVGAPTAAVTGVVWNDADGDGRVNFANIAHGSYMMRVVPPTGYQLTTRQPVEVTVQAAGEVDGDPIGLKPDAQPGGSSDSDGSSASVIGGVIGGIIGGIGGLIAGSSGSSGSSAPELPGAPGSGPSSTGSGV